jgi:hypothetical protein
MGKNFMNLKTKTLNKIPVTVIVSVKMKALNLPCLEKLKRFHKLLWIDSVGTDDTLDIAAAKGQSYSLLEW